MTVDGLIQKLNLDKSQIYRVESGARLVVMYSGGGRSGSDKVSVGEPKKTNTKLPNLVGTWIWGPCSADGAIRSRLLDLEDVFLARLVFRCGEGGRREDPCELPRS